MCVSRLHQVLAAGPPGGHSVMSDLDGREHHVSLLAYEGPPLEAGDWVTVHSGYALALVAREEAEAVRAMVHPDIGEVGTS
jgi:hydrogenase maturation factor